eukprot:gene8675-11721_t
MSTSDSIDVELYGLINRLSKIQKEVGGGKVNASLIDSHGNIDRFVDLRNRMDERIENLTETIELVVKLEKSPGANPRDLISSQSKVRTELALLQDEWRDLDALFRIETKKKRSKFPPEELAKRQEALVDLQNQIQAMKEAQRAGYVKGYKAVRLVSMEQSELFRQPPPSLGGATDTTGTNAPAVAERKYGVTGSRNDNMNDSHRLALKQIKARDAKIDDEIELIGQGVDELRELAMAANEEVKLQNRMLDTLEAKIDDVHNHVTNINSQLKITLDEARKSDKICVDIFCVLLLVGMIIVVYKLSTANQSKSSS